MKKHQLKIYERVISEAETFKLTENATVRSIAQISKVSKSTVHKDLTERLEEFDRSLYLEVQERLTNNKDERHIRGGQATKQKYLQLKRNKVR